MVGGRAQQRAIERVTPKEQVEVVLERQADPAVQLHAVLQQHRAVLPHVRHRLLASSPASRATRQPRRRGIGDGVARFEPGLHVGEAMLQRLVRRERPAEGVPVERPLDRHLERTLHRADLRREEDERLQKLPFHVGRTPADIAEHRGRGTRTSSKRAIRSAG